jgi:RNA polymerase sigma-70 factor (ECF subfamily)
MSQKVLVDQSVFEAYVRGDEAAFARIYHLHKGEIYMFAVKILKSKEDAEDTTLKVFAKLWEYRDRIESLLHLRRWAFFTARNLCINTLRDKQKIWHPLTDSILLDTLDPNSDQEALEKEQVWTAVMEELWTIVRKLPPMRRKVLLMRFQENKSMEEIASILEIRPQTVYNHMARAKDQMRKLLYEGHFREKEALIVLVLLSLSATHPPSL